MTTPSDELIETARAVPMAEAAERLGLRFAKKGHEHPQPCPKCGGTDRFSFSTKDGKWVCRGEGVGGRDAIGMAAHVRDLDTRRRPEFLEACALVTGLPVPEDAERETAEEKAARAARVEARRLRNAQEADRRARDENAFREAERRAARGIHDTARPLSAGDAAMTYLARRTGMDVPAERCWLRFRPRSSYWHGRDERGHLRELHCGPAMIAPFIVLETPSRKGEGSTIIGCHITWIDLAAPPKFRPEIFDPESGEQLPTKKMRGSKKGGLIPIVGDPSARRWLGGEGIENGVAVGGAEGWRRDTFYFAAGDLGNLAGPADPASRFVHPALTRPDRNGVERPVMIAGSLPRAGQGPDDAMPVPDHVDELVLLADGDSETVATAAAMVRAKLRLARPGRLVPVVWPLPGTDWALLLARRSEAFDMEGAAA